jgi:hypothetical protein
MCPNPLGAAFFWPICGVAVLAKRITIACALRLAAHPKKDSLAPHPGFRIVTQRRCRASGNPISVIARKTLGSAEMAAQDGSQKQRL